MVGSRARVSPSRKVVIYDYDTDHYQSTKCNSLSCRNKPLSPCSSAIRYGPPATESKNGSSGTSQSFDSTSYRTAWDLSRFQHSRGNLGPQGIDYLIKDIYNIIQQQNSKVIEERFICLEESLYNAHPGKIQCKKSSLGEIPPKGRNRLQRKKA